MTERPTYPRSTCCIAGCPKWSRKFGPGSEWICGRHWKTVRRSRRKALRTLWRARKAKPNDLRLWERESFIWRVCKREATLKAAGL